jgi:hypothetical protein
MRSFAVLYGLLALLAACAQPAARAAPAPVAAVAPRADGLDYFVGAWSATARDPSTGEEIAFEYRVEPVLGGTWLRGAGEGPGLKATDMWGRDPAGSGIIRVVFDGSGVYALVRSAGWAGDTLVLEGEVPQRGGAMRVRETIRRVGPDTFEAVWEAFRDGAWAPYSIERLTRRT